MMRWWDKFINRNRRLARETEEADELVAVVDEITFDGENFWMREGKEPDLKTCVIKCVDEDDVRAT